jgi:hypothetical protein
VATKGHPPSVSDSFDDPLLPFVIAARAGDRGAERELLVKIAPIALEVARRALGRDEPRVNEFTLQTLLATLRALPTFRGEEPIYPAIARMALERARRESSAFDGADEEVLAAAERLARRGPRSADSSRISALVDQALQDDAAVLVSQFVRRGPPKPKRSHAVIAAVLLSLAGLVGFLLTRTHSAP